MIITDPSDETYETTSQQLKRTISNSESNTVKSAAIHTLGATTFYGGAALEETQVVMEYLLEIIESDGASVDAIDSEDVVTAALEEWGFLATQVEDMEEESQAAIEAFVEQLDSSDAAVQIAAGENIALLYEKSYTELEDDESSGSDNADDGDGDDDEAAAPGMPKLIKRYEPYRRVEHLKQQLSSLASVSSRRLSKRDRKSLHVNFADILNSVENPRRGPRYQKALNHETGREYGNRMTVHIQGAGTMRIDRWWKLHRLQALRRILGGGFMTHYERNAAVSDTLP